MKQTKTTTRHQATGPINHPSNHGYAPFERECAVCGETFLCTECREEDYLFHGRIVGSRDPEAREDYCVDCADDTAIGRLWLRR